MSRRAKVMTALEGVLLRASDAELYEIARMESVLALQATAAQTLELVRGTSARAKDLVEGICTLSQLCIMVAVETGLHSALPAEILSESLSAAAHLFAAENEEALAEDQSIDRLKHMHKAPTARFLEPLGEALDGFALEILESLRRLESVLKPEWVIPGGGLGGHMVLCADEVAPADMQRFEALQAVGVWALEFLVRAVDRRRFSARELWAFASGDVFIVLVLVKAVFSFQRGNWTSTSSTVPEDLLGLRDAVLGAVLGLTGPDVAFMLCDDGEDPNVDITVRQEQLLLHRANIAAAAADMALLDCLLAYPWAVDHMAVERIPAFASFLVDLVGSSAVPTNNLSLGFYSQVQELQQYLSVKTRVLWSILPRLANPTRGFVRDCATLAYVVTPPEPASSDFIQCCLSQTDVVFADTSIAASLVIFAVNAGCPPEGSLLTQMLMQADVAVRSQIHERIQSWQGSVRNDFLLAWSSLLEAASPAPTPAPMPDPTPTLVEVAAPPRPSPPGLKDLVQAAPTGFRCAIDGRLLVDPVRVPCGHVAERSVLLHRLQQEAGHCPWTGAPLTIAECPRDPELRRQILAWIRQNRPKQNHLCL